MPIDFHNESNRLTYARRKAADDWRKTVGSLVDVEGAHVVDVGCGGGIYTEAWLDLGAEAVTGVDFSAVMLSGARERVGDRAGVFFRQADALATGLPDGCADVVFQRALIHHLTDLTACFAEAHRLLKSGGTLIVQDRTLEDIERPGDRDHLRGWFFERYPRLLDVERRRRPCTEDIESAIIAARLANLRTLPLTEVRREHAGREEVAADLTARTGRSILHELSDQELDDLVRYIVERLPAEGPVSEADRWTVWTATRSD